MFDKPYVRRPDGTCRTALITGAGSGIGRELCRCFHAAGFDVVAASLLDSELISLKEELDAGSQAQHVRVSRVDLAKPGAAGHARFLRCARYRFRCAGEQCRIRCGVHVQLPGRPTHQGIHKGQPDHPFRHRHALAAR